MAKSATNQLTNTVTPLNHETQSSDNETGQSHRREKIAELAYRFWEENGRQEGTAQLDWIRAEEEFEA